MYCSQINVTTSVRPCLENYNANSVCVKIPALRVNFLVETDNVHSEVLDDLEVKKESVIGGGSVLHVK